MINKKAVSQRINQIMTEVGMNQKSLSVLLGISQPAVSHYLQGRMPPPETLLQIPRLGNTTMEWLLTGSTTNPEAKLQIQETRPPYGKQAAFLALWETLPKEIQADLLALMQHIAQSRHRK